MTNSKTAWQDIESKNVKSAIKYLADQGKAGAHGILHLSKPTAKYRAASDRPGELHHGKKFAVKDLLKVALFYASGGKGLISPKDATQLSQKLGQLDSIKAAKFLGELDFQIHIFKDEIANDDKTVVGKTVRLLSQFHQIVLSGPPGTGKTFSAKQALKKFVALEEDDDMQLQQGGLWNIVQFHPSYNYEDFVRGIRAEPVGGNIAYEMVNRIFGEMCANAIKHPKENSVLIIDEINRANVSAVLGELIYALEYRGEKVATPYAVSGKKELVIPENLYVIGTMNTADRTIGQIDYAVRRRFAFMHCEPQESVITDEAAQEFFARVDALFVKNDKKTPSDFISPDFDAADVRVGHSYFLATERKLGYKLVYQVVPILREYVKDGVLQKSAASEIDEIEADAKNMLLGESAESDSPDDDDERAVPGTSLFYHWKTKKRDGFDRTSRVWLAFVRDYVKEHNPKDLESLISEMSARESSVKKLSETTRNSCYTQDAITLANGDEVATSKHSWNNAEEFADAVKEFGYQINSCHIVNIGEGASRSWQDSRRYGFISAGGTQSYHTQIRNLREGDFVFAKWAQDAPVRGCIACGKVVAKATPIAEFKIADGKLLLDCETESGEKFRDKYRSALEREYPDLAVAVEWTEEDYSENPIQLRSSVRQFRAAKIDNEDWKKLRQCFKILGEKEGH